MGFFITKEQNKLFRDITNLNERIYCMDIVKGIQTAQWESLYSQNPITSVTLNVVVPDAFVAYMKGKEDLTVTDDKTGQPSGYTKLISVSWNS